MSSPLMPARSLTPEGYARARRLLMRRDPVLAAVIRQIGACGLASRQHADHLSALVGSIISQQLSGKAAATIFGRFRALFPDAVITGPAIAALDDRTMRGVGLSGQKISYMRDLSARIADNRLNLEELDRLAAGEVIERLAGGKG